MEAKARRLELDSSVTAQIKRSLTELEAELYSSRPEVSEEVRRIAQLVDIGQGANAIRCIVKIMDNLITERYAHDLGYKEWSQRGGKDKAKGVEGACFYMLEYAVSLGEINREEVCFFRGIKEIRHKDSHELAVEVEAYLEAPALMIGIGGILNFAKLPPLTERKNL